MDERTNLNSQIEHGLDCIDSDRTVTLPLRDLLYVHQTLGELVRFFHQPTHYPTIDSVQQFLGVADSDDAFAAIKRCYYDLLRDCWPTDIAEMFDDGSFDSPIKPFYSKPDHDGR